MSIFEMESSSSSEGGGGGSLVLSVVGAVGSPVVYAIVYTIDKLAIDRRVQSTVGYVPFVGFLDVAFGLVLMGVCGEWDRGTVGRWGVWAWAWPLLAGAAYGVAEFVYFFALEGADVSRVSGVEDFYPVLVAVLSRVFLGDRIPPVGYAGIALSTLGAVCLSLDAGEAVAGACCPGCAGAVAADRAPQPPPMCGCYCCSDAVMRVADTRDDSCWCFQGCCGEAAGERVPLAINADAPPPPSPARRTSRRRVAALCATLVGAVALNEFFTKLAVRQMPPPNVSGLSSVVSGSMMTLLLPLSRDARRTFVFEAKKNWLFAILSEGTTLVASLLLAVGMVALSAPIVSSIASIQPLVLLVLERLLSLNTDTRLECLAYKLPPMLLIIAGIVCLSLVIVDS